MLGTSGQLVCQVLDFLLQVRLRRSLVDVLGFSLFGLKLELGIQGRYLPRELSLKTFHLAFSQLKLIVVVGQLLIVILSLLIFFTMQVMNLNSFFSHEGL